jgi:hypothetical protein
MRDIRSDLVDRLELAKVRLAARTERYDRDRDALEMGWRQDVAELERERDALRTMLGIEDKREGLPPTALPPGRKMPFSDFVLTAVHTHGPIGKEDLRSQASAAGYDDDGTLGRTLHTTLMNYVKAGKLILQAGGLYVHAGSSRSLADMFGAAKEEAMSIM